MKHEGPNQQPAERKILRLNAEGAEHLNWKKWRQDLNAYMGKGDIEGAANLLACSFDGTDSLAEEDERRIMFAEPALEGYREQLWKLIRPQITEEYQDSIYKKLNDEYGWDI